MKKYTIVGSYSAVELSHTETDLSCTVVVPLINCENKLKYGLDGVINKLLDKGIIPSEDGIDFLCFALLVYLADTRISRVLHSQDSWTREIAISLPVYNPDKWNGSVDTITRMLNFLTGDLWEIVFLHRNILQFPALTLCNSANGGKALIFRRFRHLPFGRVIRISRRIPA